MPPAPSYQQVREPAVTKQSPHRAAASDTPAKSPKAKCSNSKSRPPQGSRHSSNTSTLKHQDSMSAKKPSCPKKSTPDDQARSPQACSSHNTCATKFLLKRSVGLETSVGCLVSGSHCPCAPGVQHFAGLGSHCSPSFSSRLSPSCGTCGGGKSPIHCSVMKAERQKECSSPGNWW